MKSVHLLVAAAPLALATPALAETASVIAAAAGTTATAATDAAQDAAAPRDIVTTGVARGRDRLDMAISTSSLSSDEILKLGAPSVAEILRAIPGIRSEATGSEGNSSLSIRGLPIASTGAHFVQIQEDGLPVLEFGDIALATSDSFVRADLNLSQVETIRGGSASTFASNSPGGVINFKSRTGETEGGAVQTTVGLDYESYRIDFAYGAPINDRLRFQIGGFYRTGEGQRSAGYDAYRGGQIKLNVTQDFEGGYIRFYGKFLDDSAPVYDQVPMRVTGTNADPSFDSVTGFEANGDSLLTRYFTTNITLDGENNVSRHDVRDGQRSQVKSVGLEAQFEVAGWTVTDRFRYSDMARHFVGRMYPTFGPAAMLAMQFGGPGATLRYANGPQAGQTITDPNALNGNGLLALLTVVDVDLHSLNYGVNDLRASRVWEIGGGNLTTTAGIYNSRQTIDSDWLWTQVVSEVRGDGEAALLDIVSAGGVPQTQDGFFSFDLGRRGGQFRRSFRLDYAVNAPFASLNYHVGNLVLGGSLRYDFGHASGSVFGSDLGAGRVGTTARDMNGDGVISVAERYVAVLPLTSPAPVDYDFGYLSYSVGVNYRIAEPLAVFGRYSRGGRLNADRILFSPIVSPTDGSILIDGAAVDFVKQAEVGVKYRTSNLTLNLTGFWAATEDTNIDSTNGAPILREYEAMGLEFEGGYRWGGFSLTAGATYTDAEITADQLRPELIGNTPRHQAELIFQATPQYSTDRFAVGAVFIGTTGSFAQDTNELRMPGYVTTNAFVQFRPTERLLLSLNADNLFDVTAFTGINQATLPVNGIVGAHLLNGRTISATARFDF
ncbi:TonB-dependent receptor domain-containing protein [Sphingosinicella terrae]|uniref:TonB-dependent receptor domain-containing protein n=1 Tax=Sphingosinicella terrae TaxID=2172047 RepID=UPI000E0D66E9|nr:TonB-dependent receptor [Sphingosinicella terrae]